jgi:hypothetical protein
MKSWKPIWALNKRMHDFMHACLFERIHSMRFRPCHLDRYVFELTPWCFCVPWAFLHRKCLQTEYSHLSIVWTPSWIWNQFLKKTLVLIKWIKLCLVAWMLLFLYLCSDPSGSLMQIVPHYQFFSILSCVQKNTDIRRLYLSRLSREIGPIGFM